MKNTYKITRFLVGIYLTILVGCTTDETQSIGNNFTKLSISDEFNNDGTIDSSLWSFDIGTGDNGWGNNELQYYTDRPENIKIENGMLHFIARQEPFQGSNFTSARIKTQGKFEKTYGRFEAKIQLPWGQGIWPAFWLLGNNCEQNDWPLCGEIDIMEYRGQNPIRIDGSVHGPGYSAGESVSKGFILENDRFDTGFHIFGIEWGPDFINFYVDDTLYNQITPADVPGDWVFNHPFYIIMNVAVGGSFVGPPNDNTLFPQTMLVDYIRVYE
ncbi:MAG: glycosyl hydrolase family 16 [Flavobacteriaceae bacterium CG2_30_34_30]|nr:glycoside hydrolase family 16 protein [Flavobacteriia bacterium]OIP52754.1 MAG: glycosyl hydrolase family 16 [Flavobacteriaceae bacterium CG2_30_34_30]PIQ17701.1 MAG: glycosyl hydrolase family 16 [Flavobacteriaceae bacterium CG18_big_fil_WC_8_21_14_2_50_34_36]PIV51208.1 MAG: glycosyl hydrolase family 16 [Flavobacteriaceae bacterium CG02_land_8_20_14_3_00_34_13]PIZ07849.1 MAG: glycosyl hydrolase family 16 [Flavobacteriaceae bacterium CG_4_10_14_0_8_um_filter_34_31]PJC07433.1 MAG: glycosyl hy